MTEDKPSMAQVNTSLPIHILTKIQDFADHHGMSRSAAMRHILTWHATHMAGANAIIHIVPGDDIQTALDACPPGGTVILGPGNYTVNKTLIIPSTIKMQGVL